MNSNVEIISDGTPTGTKIFVGGVEIKGVQSIVISPIKIDEFLTATITLIGVKLGKVNG